MRFAFFLVAALAPFFIADAAAGDRYRLLSLKGQIVKWGAPELGAGARLTYALVETGIAVDGARNCPRIAPVETLSIKGAESRAAVAKAAEQAFAMWSAVADIIFERALSPEEADILIGAGERGWAYADVFPVAADGPVASLERSLVCLNAAKRWKTAFGGDDGAQDLRYTLAHEIGHAIGLNHPGPHGALMSFNYGESFASLQPGDIAGARALYGPPRDDRLRLTGDALISP